MRTRQPDDPSSADATPLSVQIMLASRPGFFLNGRANARLWQIISPNGSARGPGRIALAIAFLGLDVALARWMTRTGSTSTRIAPRLLLDMIDSAVWTALAPGHAEAGLLPMVTAAPLAAEAGFVLRWRGVAVACAAPCASLVVRLWRGQPLRPAQMLWPVVSALPGPLIRYIDDWLDARADAVNGQIEARTAEARRQESARILLTADPIVDELRDVARKIAIQTGTSTTWEHLDQLKHQLTDWAQGDGRTFLGSELLSHESRRHSPDVQQKLTFNVSREAGITILSHDQRIALSELLGTARLNGRVAVDVIRQSRVGVRSTNAILTFDEVAVELPGPVPLTVREFDSTAVVQALTAVFELIPMLDHNGGARWWACVPAAASSALHGLWAAHSNPSSSPEGRRRSLRWAALTQICHTVALRHALRTPHNDQGFVRTPFRFGLFGVMMSVGSQIGSASGADIRRLVGWSVLSAAAGWFGTAEPRDSATIAADVFGATPGLGVMETIKSATDRMTDEWTLDSESVRRATEDQQRQNLDLLRTWLDHVTELVTTADLPPVLRSSLTERVSSLRKQMSAMPNATSPS